MLIKNALSNLHRCAPALLTLCAAVFGSAAVAQTLSLDNVAPIPLTTSSSVSAVSIDTSSGNVTVRTSGGLLNQCTGGGGGSNPTINSFAPSSTAVPPSSAFSLSWTSSNTTSCSGQLGTGTTWASLGTLGTSGTQNLTTPATLGTITFQLTCTDGAQSVSAQTSVSVQNGGSGNCQPPAGTNGSSPSWASIFNTAWPSFNGVRRLQVTSTQWIGLQFTATNSATQFGTFSSSHYPGDGDGSGQVSISSTAGCFTPSELGANCLSAAGDLPGVSWSHQASAFTCKLNPGQTYFVNLWFPSCLSGSCGRDFGNIQQLLINGESAP